MQEIKIIHEHNKRNLQEIREKIASNFSLSVNDITISLLNNNEYTVYINDINVSASEIETFIKGLTIEKSDDEIIEELEKQNFLNQLKRYKNDADLKTLLQEILNNQ